MKRRIAFLLCLLPLLLVGIQARPIVEISVADNWTYEGTETFDYLVTDKQDFENGEEYVELTQIETNEILEVVSPSIVNETDKWMGYNVSLYLDAIFTTADRWHTSRGNFIAIIEKTGTFNLTKIVNGTISNHTGEVTYKRFYLDFDLQSPIVTGNPIYADRLTLWKLMPVNITFIDTTTYRIDATDEWTYNYQGTDTPVRNVTVEPMERNQYSIWNDFTVDRNVSTVGMERYLWVFANDIGLPIYKQVGYVQAPSALKLAVYDETYDLTAFSVALSIFEVSKTGSFWETFVTVFFSAAIASIVTTYLLLRRKR